MPQYGFPVSPEMRHQWLIKTLPQFLLPLFFCFFALRLSRHSLIFPEDIVVVLPGAKQCEVQAECFLTGVQIWKELDDFRQEGVGEQYSVVHFSEELEKTHIGNIVIVYDFSNEALVVFNQGFLVFGPTIIHKLNEESDSFFIGHNICDVGHKVFNDLFFFLCEHAGDTQPKDQLGNHEGVIVFLDRFQTQIMQQLLSLQIALKPFLTHLDQFLFQVMALRVSEHVLLEDNCALVTTLQKNVVLRHTRQLILAAYLCNSVQCVFRFYKFLPVLDGTLVHGCFNAVAAPLKHQLEDTAACLFLHVDIQEGFDLFKVFLDFFESVRLWDFEHVLDCGQHLKLLTFGSLDFFLASFHFEMGSCFGFMRVLNFH